MKLVVLCFMVFVWLQLPTEGVGECCLTHTFTIRKEKHDVCGDCYPGYPYCSRKGCNVFGCKCEGGCRDGKCRGSQLSEADSKNTILHWERMKRVVVVRSEDAHDVIRVADEDEDGRMSLEEARRHLANRGFPAERVKRSLIELNTDDDEFLSAREIDSD